jgi:copper transport protein
VTNRTGVPGRAPLLLLAFVGAVALALVGWDDPTAHAQTLEDSSPADGAVLAEPPEEIVLTFDEEIGTSNNVSVACNTNSTTMPPPVLSSDARTLTFAYDEVPPLPQGTCVLSYDVRGPDGEDGPSGVLTFSIQSSPVTTPGVTVEVSAPPVTTAAPTDSDGDGGSSGPTLDETPTSGATWLGRLLSTLGLSVLFGSFVLIVAAWPEGPEYILAVRFLRGTWVVAMAGTVLYVVAFTAAAKGESLGSGLNPADWWDLTDAGWPGRAALARLVLCLLTGWVVLRPERVIDPTTQLPALAIPTLAVATIGLSRTGGDLAILGVIAGIGHAIAMAIWFGAVVLLARVVLAGPGDEDLVHAVRGFNRISGPAIVATILTGLVQMFRLDGGALFTTGHGRLLLVKVVVVALMLFIGMTARQIAHHRLARASDLTPPAADQLRRAFGTDAVLGVVVLGLSAGLMSYTPAKAPDEDLADFAIEKSVVDTQSGLDLVVRLQPGRVGQNRLQVEVVGPETGVSGLTVSFVAPAGSGVDTLVQPIPLTGAGIADTTDDLAAGLPFAVAGAWTLQVDATTGTGAVSGAGGSFEIRNADGSVPESDIAPTPTGAPVTSASTSTSSSAPGTTTP